MGYERNQRGGWRNDDDRDFGYGAGRDDYSSARDYAAAGQYGDRGHHGEHERGYEQHHERGNYGARGYHDDDGGQRFARGYGDRERGYSVREGGYGRPGAQGQGSRYASPYQRQGGYPGGDRARRGYTGQPQGYDYDDRDFFSRAGDEVRSWFGDDEAERRREMDRRYDERYENDRDAHYSSWRRQRINELDRDYDEYRRENATKFENEFNSFRTERQGQRSALSKVEEHMEVIGSDGEHVGTVDKVRGDRIILTKNDVDAGGRHHSIPSRWIETVEEKVRIRKTAQQAKHEWRDEERNQAMFGDNQRTGYASRTDSDDDNMGGRESNRRYSGTY
ncbi:DUF2171 domain-containing protein [Sphingomonas sp.]|uniref:DUF2171 domain-containing protein n=1 Tax=Sphingomonas sp. TaxID=28214 RepID=UPI002C7F8FD8|nr:DUF2171 domain-containing protein [Sphingomonas sp.]HTG38540.1 DUF2171 domain-containing protein [Sphingomonas sp.]